MKYVIFIALLVVGIGASSCKSESKDYILDSLAITKFPDLNGSSSWDLNSGADLFVKLFVKDSTGLKFLYETGVQDNALGSGKHTYNFNIALDDINLEYMIQLWDNDDAVFDQEDDLIIEYEFTFKKQTETQTIGEGNFEFEATLKEVEE